MNWRTEVKLKTNPGYFGYSHRTMALGSCFADEIGARLKISGFDVSVNPFGVIFNPVSIMQLIQNALDENLREQFITERDGKWYHYGYHSEVFGENVKDLLKKVESLRFNAKKRLLEADHLFLTFGTAWVWRLNENQTVVANCHKMPGDLFTRELISLERLREFSVKLFTRLFEANPGLKVTVTVSPVRYSKDGLHENNLSKGKLHLFCDFLTSKFENISYFEAYELVIDELRDYRFFKKDLVHPNEQAVDFVFEKFRQAYFDESTLRQFELHEKIRKAEEHVFMNASDEEVRKHQEYISNLKENLSGI